MTPWQAFRAKLARDRAAGVPFEDSWRRRVTYALRPASQPRARAEGLGGLGGDVRDVAASL